MLLKSSQTYPIYSTFAHECAFHPETMKVRVSVNRQASKNEMMKSIVNNKYFAISFPRSGREIKEK